MVFPGVHVPADWDRAQDFKSELNQVLQTYDLPDRPDSGMEGIASNITDPADGEELAGGQHILTLAKFHACGRIGNNCPKQLSSLGKALGAAGAIALATGSGGGGRLSGLCNSFVSGTEVLLANGTTKPIEKLKIGDEVLATDPKTGKTTVKKVTAEIKGEGLKHLVKITLRTDGKKHGKTGSVTATDGHPFWVPELQEWVDATDLQPGQWLRTSAGTRVQITAVGRWTQQSAVHNLTVTDLHTYYVLAGGTPVLVHNCGGANGGKYGDLQPAGTGKEINHIPANASSPLSKYSGPSIRMDYADHRAVYSTGSSLASQAWRTRQKQLIDAGDFRGAIQMDVDDIRARFGSKYDGAIAEMWMSLSSNKALRKWASERNP